MVCDDVTRTRWQRSYLDISMLLRYMKLAAVLTVSTGEKASRKTGSVSDSHTFKTGKTLTSSFTHANKTELHKQKNNSRDLNLKKIFSYERSSLISRTELTNSANFTSCCTLTASDAKHTNAPSSSSLPAPLLEKTEALVTFFRPEGDTQQCYMLAGSSASFCFCFQSLA